MKDTNNMPKYRRCKHYVRTGLFGSGKHYCAPDAKTLREQIKQKQEIDIAKCENCEKFESRYIEYPLTISSIDIKQPETWGICFTPVRVRPCDGNGTYFGILLGNFPYLTSASFDENTRALKVSTATNPCILIPSQKRIVFGAQSWWQEIDPGEDLSNVRGISDSEIENTWYVSLLRKMTQGDEREPETGEEAPKK